MKQQIVAEFSPEATPLQARNLQTIDDESDVERCGVGLIAAVSALVGTLMDAEVAGAPTGKARRVGVPRQR